MVLVKGLTEYLKKNMKTEIKTKGEMKMDIIELNGRKYKAIEEVKEEELKEGDYIVCKEGTENPYSFTNEDMKLGEIVDVSIDTMTIRVVAHEVNCHEMLGKGHNYPVSNQYFRKATKEEIEKYKNGNPKHKIKAGDYVKGKSGRFYEVLEVNTDLMRAVKVKCLRSGVYYDLPFEDATKVELTERELSYIRAGREINHIKEGDIISNITGIRISERDYPRKDNRFTLICPVDKRTDI